MLCRCVISGGYPGFVLVRERTAAGTVTRYEPCPDCGGTQREHCCDGLTACNDPPPVDDEAMPADD